MLKYLIIFGLLGFLLSKFIDDEKTLFGIFLGISVLWGLSSAPIWGLVTLGELALGYFVGNAIKNKND
jgi:hypothetical protein